MECGEIVYKNHLLEKGLIVKYIGNSRLRIKKHIIWLKNGQTTSVDYSKWDTDGPETHEKMLHIINHQENAN